MNLLRVKILEKDLRLVVFGGRHYRDWRRVFAELDLLCPSLVIHGACRTGADHYARLWCSLNHIPDLPFAAEWGNVTRPGARVKELADGTKYDSAAGPYRNERMIIEGKPNAGLAFPGGDGTADMMKRMTRHSIHTIIIPHPTVPAHEPTRYWRRA